jgi:predicted RNase H-like HicB family nuclease
MIYDVYLQVKRTGCTHAHVPALPGCNWLASSPDAAWEQATAAIQDHLDWLRRYVRQAAPLDEPVLPQLAQQNNNPQSIPIQPASRSVWKRLERMQVLSFEKLMRSIRKAADCGCGRLERRTLVGAQSIPALSRARARAHPPHSKDCRSISGSKQSNLRRTWI